MDQEKTIGHYIKNFHSQLKLEQEKGITNDYKEEIGRIAELGDFVLANFDKFTSEQKDSFLYLCTSANSLKSTPKELNENILGIVNAMINQTEDIYGKLYGYQRKATKTRKDVDYEKAYSEGVTKVRSALEQMERNYEHCALVYVMNRDSIMDFAVVSPDMEGTTEQFDTVYYPVMGKVRELLDDVKRGLVNNDNLGQLADMLKDSYDLCSSIFRVIKAKDFASHHDSLSIAIRNYNEIKKKYGVSEEKQM